MSKIQIDAKFQEEYEDLVKGLPTRSPIFLPTEKISLKEKVAGVKLVKEIYDARLDRIYRPKIRALREKHKGQKRCFIIGNGPSLNSTDLDCLRDEVTFAVNGFFLKSEELGWAPTYYVVEDHLVAEDRREWINSFKGSTKLFPVYLAYCLPEGEDTIFYNHRPRKSYPDGFDFSEKADQITYTGCTVTFSCMQLAHYMGFEEIYLIGVDASYEIPKDVKEGDDYSVGVLDMKSDDPNHFHPDYFGKGFRWHDPQVHKMVEAYEEAKLVTDKSGRRIYNATIGGKLEVFDRVDFGTIFPDARPPEKMEALNQKQSEKENKTEAPQNVSKPAAPNRHFPKVLMFDITNIGNGTATGEIKQNLFREWPNSKIMQFHTTGKEKFGWKLNEYQSNPDASKTFLDDAKKFEPEVILYRPVLDNLALHNAAMKTIRSLNIPFVIWIMDDWPRRFMREQPEKFFQIEDDLNYLITNASERLSICEAMSHAFHFRYGKTFIPLANGVDPKDWAMNTSRNSSNIFKVRYAGSLASNMTLDSLKRIAAAVESLASESNVKFEIKTSELWYKKTSKEFEKFPSTTMIKENLPADKYRKWLQDADALVIAYNFDEDSINYVRYSMANKMPECLAAGAPILCHGPSSVATVSYLSLLGCAEVVSEADEGSVKDALKHLIGSEDRRNYLVSRAQTTAFDRHNLDDLCENLRQVLSIDTPEVSRDACSSSRPLASLKYTRDDHAKVDETNIVFELFEHSAPKRMLDVGAHYGSSAKPFADKGWRVHCFEPDPSNREHLVKKFKKTPNVTIDDRAVGETPEKAKPFFSSEESTGISGMLAFRDSHEQSALVDVTTVEEIIRDNQISHIDFLKIDVEGYDLSVLKGVPWDAIKPDVIECEFEDAKTVHLGHTWEDICKFLNEKGYEVYVSEWHPIIRYGIAHDWFTLKKYPCTLSDDQAWGNLLAFKRDPGEQAIYDAVQKVVVLRN